MSNYTYNPFIPRPFATLVPLILGCLFITQTNGRGKRQRLIPHRYICESESKVASTLPFQPSVPTLPLSLFLNGSSTMKEAISSLISVHFPVDEVLGNLLFFWDFGLYCG